MATQTVDQITAFGETVAYKAPCRVATTGNITLSGLQSIDGVTVAADDRVLVRAQSTASQNGIYIASSGTWQRARDLDSNRDVTKGTRVTVTDGLTLAGKEYQITTANPITVGTSALTFAETLSSDAGSSATAAAASASAAAGSATAAAGSATAASSSATNAATSATNASTSATDAAGSASAASTQASNASTSATAAATSAINAANSATAAAGSATSASGSASLAQAWAEEDEDVEVEPGLFSAKHWAAKSQESASDVTSVNGQTGTVVLSAADIGAVAKSGDTMTGGLEMTALGLAYGVGHYDLYIKPGDGRLVLWDGATEYIYLRNTDIGTTAGTVAAGDDSRITGAVQTSRQVVTSTGLTGGGNLSADRTLSVDKATDANVRSAASNKVLTADLLESAAAETSVAETGSSPTLSLANFDWDLFINGAVTLSASRTLSNPATSQVGTWRRLIVTQNGTGGYTLSFGNQYRFPGGIVPVVASAANAVTTLDIYCRSASLFDVYAAIGMAS